MFGASADIIGLNTDSSINVFGIPLLILGGILFITGLIYTAQNRYKYSKNS